MKRLIYISLIAIFSASCIDPYFVDIKPVNNNLIIEGQVTNDRGPFRIKLSRFEAGTRATEAESGARVFILDDLGNSIELFEQPESPGEYLSAVQQEFEGEIGRTYFVEIATADGENYRSEGETMLPVPPIEAVSYSKGIRSFVTPGGTPVDQEQLQINVRFNTLSEGPTHLRFDYRSIYFLATQLPCEGCPCPRCPSVCYFLDEPVDFLNVFESEVSESVSVERRLVNLTLDMKYAEQYRIQVRQYSLTEEAARFWRTVEEQRISTGSIFDPPPAIIRGNVYNINDADEEVLGYFSASAYSDMILPISVGELEISGFRMPFFYEECRRWPFPDECYFCPLYEGKRTTKNDYQW